MGKKNIKEMVFDATDYSLYESVKGIIKNKALPIEEIWGEAYKRFIKYGFNNEEAEYLSERLYIELK